MGFAKLIRDGVALANKMTEDIQAKVIHRAYLSSTGSGKKLYSPDVSRPAIVDWEQRQIRTLSGNLSVSRATVTFLDPSVVVDDNDIIILPDGTTGPILDMSGFIDSGTGHPYLTKVFLG